MIYLCISKLCLPFISALFGGGTGKEESECAHMYLIDGDPSCVNQDTGEGPSHRLARGGQCGEAPEWSERSVGAEAEQASLADHMVSKLFPLEVMTGGTVLPPLLLPFPCEL